MAVLDGIIVQSPLAGFINDRLSTGLNAFGFDEWPPHDSIAGESRRHDAVVSALPVSAITRVIAGHRCVAPSDDWYHRVHLIPQSIDIGNLVSTQVLEVLVWNAWLRPVTLNAIEGVSEGLSLEGEDDFPVEMGPIDLLAWDLSITADGPTAIDTQITWDFSDANDVTLSITGTRIVAWPILPNWTDDGIIERLAWATEVHTSEERDEQRRALRLSPNRSFSIEMLVDGRERSLYDLMMRGWGGRIWAMPVWPDVQLLGTEVTLGATSITCSTTGRDFVAGGLAMLRGESPFVNEVVEIESVESGSLTLVRPTQMAWPVRSRLYPVRTARFDEQPEHRRLTDQALEISATFVLVEASDWSEASLPTYRDLPVYDARPDESEDLTGTFERAMYELGNEVGFPFVLDAADAAFGTQAHRWVLNGISERSTYRSLLYALRGRQVSVWLPTHADDLRLVSTITSASVLATIENVEYSRFGVGQLGRQDIRIELKSGTVYYRRIVAAAPIDTATEQITLDSALGANVAPADVARISFMMLARSSSDETEIRHVTDVMGVATSRKVFVGVADE